MGAKTKEQRIEEAKAKQERIESAKTENQNIASQSLTNNDLSSNPLLSAGIKEREYSSTNDIKIEGDIPYQIPEPEQNRLTVDFNTTSENTYSSDDGDNSNDNENNGVFDTRFAEKDKKEQSILAGNFSSSIVDIYVGAWNMINNACTYSIEELQYKAALGKFNIKILSTDVDLGGEKVPVQDFLKVYNESVSECCTLEEDVEKEMRLLVKRISVKRGLGLSDEGRLGLLVGQDLIKKIPMLIKISSDMRQILKNQEKKLTEAKFKSSKTTVNPDTITSDRNDTVKEKGEK